MDFFIFIKLPVQTLLYSQNELTYNDDFFTGARECMREVKDEETNKFGRENFEKIIILQKGANP